MNGVSILRRLLPAMAIVGSLVAPLSVHADDTKPARHRPVNGSLTASAVTPAPVKPPVRLNLDPLALLTMPADRSVLRLTSPVSFPGDTRNTDAKKGIGPMLRQADRPAIDASRGDFFANHQIGIQFRSGF
jgi:hypothetical protein